MTEKTWCIGKLIIVSTIDKKIQGQSIAGRGGSVLLFVVICGLFRLVTSILTTLMRMPGMLIPLVV